MTSNTQSISLVLASVVSFALAGCALNTSEPAATNLAGKGISGNVHGGQQPVANSVVTVHAAGTTGYGSADSILATVTADSQGNFQFAPTAYTCPQVDTPIYLLATGGNPGAGNNPSLVEAAGLGACTDAKNAIVQINEVSTVATAYALAQFFTPTLGSGSTDSFGAPSVSNGTTTTYFKGLTMANAVTIPALDSLPGGLPQAATATSSVDDAKIRTLANIIATCVNSTGATSSTETTTPCGQLFAATTPPGATTRPSDPLQAAVMMAKYPYNNVASLFNLSPAAGPFGGGSSNLHDLTVAIRYTTPTMALTPVSGSSSNLDIDAAGNIWLPSTAPAGVAMFNPAAQTFSGPYTQAGIVHPQTVAISTAGYVYLSDLGSGLLSAFTGAGAAAGQYNSLGTSQTAVAIGPQNQIWLTASGGAGGNNVVELQGGLLSATQTNLLTGATSHPASGLTVTATNDVYSATTDGTNSYLDKFAASTYVGALPVLPVDQVLASFGAVGAGQIAQNGTSIVQTTPGTNTFCTVGPLCIAQGQGGMSTPVGIATDGDNKVWTANSGNSSVSASLGLGSNFAQFSPIAFQHSATYGGQFTSPRGIGMDASGNVWVSNATVAGGPYVLTELVGAAAPTITPIAAQITGGTNRVGSRPTN